MQWGCVRALLAAVAAVAAGQVAPPPRIIQTFAGADWVFTGDGKPAQEAPLARAPGVATDRQGNVFVADHVNHLVLKIAPNGILTIAAGNGVRGFSGDGGLATNAALNTPLDVAADSRGNVYIADSGTFRVRQVRPNGTIVTVAGGGSGGDGGPATSAALNSPAGVALDAAGNLIIAESGGRRIRKVAPNGIISTVAGTGQGGSSGDGGPATAATLTGPVGVAFDGLGNLYIADTGSHRVRKVDGAGVITTLAGDGLADYRGDGGPASRASLRGPRNVAADGAGNIYISDNGNSRVRKVGPDGIIQTVAGDGVQGTRGDDGPALQASLYAPAGIALDAANHLYIGDLLVGLVRKVDPAGIITTLAGNLGFRSFPEGAPARQAFLFQPGSVRLDAAGNFHIADQQNARIRQVSADGRVSTLAGTGVFGCAADGLAATAANIGFVGDVLMESTGTMLFSETGCSRIRRITTRGTLLTVAGNPLGLGGFGGDGGPATGALLRAPAQMSFDAAGNLYIADQGNGRIRRVTPQGIITTVAGNGQPSFSGDGGPALAAGIGAPSGVTFDLQGNLVITSPTIHRVRRVGADGRIQTIAGTGVRGFSGEGGPAINAMLNLPGRVRFDAAGNMFIADIANHRIRVVDPAGVIRTIAGAGTLGYTGDGGPATGAALNGPTDVAVDAAGNLYIADVQNDAIRVVLSGAPSFQVSPATLSFSASSGGAAAAEQLVSAFSPVTALPFSVAVATAGGGPWLRASPPSGLLPSTIHVTANPENLAPGTYSGSVTVTAAGAAPPTRSIAVSFTVERSEPPKLTAEPSGAAFSFLEQAAAETQQVKVFNRGGGSLAYAATATTNRGGQWLQAAPASGTVTAAGPVSLAVRADPSGLLEGTYTGLVRVSSSTTGESVDVAVTMSVSDIPQSILLSQSGLTYTAVAGGGVVPSQSFAVLNTGQGVMGWRIRASTLSGGASWLAATPGSGSSDARSLVVPFVEVAVNASGLAPGEYYGQVEVTAEEADNSPQNASIVVNVLPAGSDPGPLLRPTGLVFTGIAEGASPSSQTVVVSNLSSRTKSYVSGRLTSDERNWFASVPGSAAVTPQQPARIVVQPDLEGLTPGIRRGTLTLQFDDGTPRTVSLLFVLIAGQGTRSTVAQAGCTPSRLLPVFTLLAENFNVSAAWPNPVEVRVVDDCANPMVAGSVALTFSNTDPPLSLVSLRDGRWSGTWQARDARPGQVTVRATAEIRELGLAGSAQVTGGLQTNPNPPAIGAGAVVSAASYAPRAPLAPGSLVAVFGTRLSEGLGESNRLPLETLLAGATVLIGGRPMPLLFASEGQINGMVPFGIAANTRHQVVVRRGSSYTVPESVTVAAAQPAVFSKDATGKGQGLIVDTAFQLVEPGNAVRAGDAIVIYCSGLGAVDPPVTAGLPAPASPPLSETVDPVSVSIGGVQAQVFFAGLAPGFAGLYQVNAFVPPGVAAGNEVPVIVSVAGQSSPPVTIAVQ